MKLLLSFCVAFSHRMLITAQLYESEEGTVLEVESLSFRSIEKYPFVVHFEELHKNINIKFAYSITRNE